jgi:hypothetical protein
MSKLPVTKARLGISVQFVVFSDDLDMSKLADGFDVASLTSSKLVIGSIEKFSESNPRKTTPRYELDYTNGGEIQERIPGLVDRTLNITRAVLYGSDMLNIAYDGAKSFRIDDVIENYKPFSIMKTEIAPEGNTEPTRTTIYTGCWFHDNPKSYDLTGNMKIIQDVEIGYVRKFVSPTDSTF